VVDQPFSENITNSATLYQSCQTVVVAADTKTLKVYNRGQDSVLKTKLPWLWNTKNSVVFRMKVELKLPENYYMEYYKLDIRKELLKYVLMDLIPIEETYGLRRGSGDYVTGKREEVYEIKVIIVILQLLKSQSIKN
jgi:hypothetical protein